MNEKKLLARIHELETALKFYSDPGSIIQGAEWRNGYPGGIAYRDGDRFICDQGGIAGMALRSSRSKHWLEIMAKKKRPTA